MLSKRSSTFNENLLQDRKGATMRQESSAALKKQSTQITNVFNIRPENTLNFETKKKQRKDSAQYLDDISAIDEDSNSISSDSLSSRMSKRTGSSKQTPPKQQESNSKIPFSSFMREPEKNQPRPRQSAMFGTDKPRQLAGSLPSSQSSSRKQTTKELMKQDFRFAIKEDMFES